MAGNWLQKIVEFWAPPPVAQRERPVLVMMSAAGSSVGMGCCHYVCSRHHFSSLSPAWLYLSPAWLYSGSIVALIAWFPLVPDARAQLGTQLQPGWGVTNDGVGNQESGVHWTLDNIVDMNQWRSCGKNLWLKVCIKCNKT